MSCGADTLANTLLASLTAGEDFTIPSFDLSGDDFDIPGGADNPLNKPIPEKSLDELTERIVGGSGAFDALMAAVTAHLSLEFKANRITGGEYTKAYIALVEVAMSNATQYVLAADQSYWNAVNAQISAITARVQLKTAAVDLASAQLKAANFKAEYGLTKMKIATEDVSFCIAEYQHTTTLPAQNALVVAQTAGAVLANSKVTFELGSLLPAQLKLVNEQAETARGQTSDTRSDGQSVGGSLGSQRRLYEQQILSYKRSSEINAAKIFSDAWIAHKAVDEGIDTPTAFNATTISQVLNSVKNNNEL